MNLSHNQITIVSGFKAKFLTELDLSFNNISSIENVELPHLRYLNLSNNKLTSLEFVPSLEQLRTLIVVCKYYISI